MALTWDISKIKDHKALWVPDPDNKEMFQLNTKTDALIWMMLFIGVYDITEENVGEVFERTAMYERVGGSICKKRVKGRIEDDPFTYEDICRHVGLKTNAGNMTRAQFAKRLIERLRRDASAKLSWQKKEKEEKQKKQKKQEVIACPNLPNSGSEA